MAKTIWNPSDRDAIIGRFERLSPDARPRWGKLDAPRMLTHVTDAIRSSMGELTLAPKPGPLKVWPINVVVMFYMPWPKGVPTAPELLDRKPVDWPTELNTLKATLDRFVARDVDGPWTPHVAFGAIDGRHWGRLMHRHLDHHLVQFGVAP